MGWPTGVDWGHVEKLQALNAEKQKQMETSSLLSGDNYVPVGKQAILSKMLEVLKPGETVPKVLHRLGGKKTMSASEILEAKKKSNIGNQVNKEEQSRKEALNTLTGYAA